MKFNFGTTVRDNITGFTGVITARVEYMNGCVQYGVLPLKLKDGVVQDEYWLDEGRIQVVKESKKAKKKSAEARPGGPQNHPIRKNPPRLGG